jgi:hypothetical protein
MKPCVIKIAKKPCTFSGIEVSNLPVHYYHSKSAFMNRDIFCDWFRKEIHSISASTFAIT